MQLKYDLTIDLPPTDYSSEDKPTNGQRIASGIKATIKAIYLFFAAVGWIAIDSVNAIGNGLAHGIDTIDALLTIIDGWVIALIAALVSALLSKAVCYVA